MWRVDTSPEAMRDDIVPAMHHNLGLFYVYVNVNFV